MSGLLASFDRRSEDIRVFAVIIPELEFGDIEREIFFADFVKCADHAALDERPEAFNRLSVNDASDVLANAMINAAERIFVGQFAVAGRGVGAKQTDFMRDGFANECGQRLVFQVTDDASNDVALASDRTDHDSLSKPRTRPATASSVPIAAFVFVPVLSLPADKGFVDLDDTAKLADVLDKRGSDFVAHKPSGLVGAEAHIPIDLQGAHSLFADQHQVRDPEPILQRLIRIFKNCPCKIRETISSIAPRSALRALPMPRAGMKTINSVVAAARAMDALWPSARDQIRFAIVLSLKQRIELRRCHLMDWLRLLLTGHGDVPRSIGGLSHV
jgi:hypothetical protein